jgi:hypothetical protein
VKAFSKIGYAIGLTLSILIIMMLIIPEKEDWHILGPSNPGHENLTCNDCHVEAEGIYRQQIQANFKALIGMRSSSVTFGFEPVTNENCIACHDRPNDNHPVFRFLESRFADARKAIAPQFCESCHLEHQGVRVTQDSTYCINCHTDLELPDDPIEGTTHTELVVNEEWGTCLGCHDFHGNHDRTVPITMDELISQDAIIGYFAQGQSPYSDKHFYEAKEHLND